MDSWIPINELKEAGYSFEEIKKIEKWFQEISEWKWIPLWEVIHNFYA